LPNRVRGLAPQASRRLAVGSSGAVAHPRHYHPDPDARRRVETISTRQSVQRTQFESIRNRLDADRKPAPQPSALRKALEENLFQISTALVVVGSLGWCLLFYTEFKSPVLFAPPRASAYAVAGDITPLLEKTDLMATSTYVRDDHPQVSGAIGGHTDSIPAQPMAIGESAASVVARDWSFFQPIREATQTLAPAPMKAAKIKPLIHVASLDTAAPPIAALRPAPEVVAPRLLPDNIDAKTALVDFETAPFPYHGNMPGSNRPFLNAGTEGHRGHVNFRGRVLWEAQTFGDDHVLLHIPPGFNPNRPAVMVVFFHGHGADLARDVRDRQRVPAQITAAGMNAVLVAPQFAFDEADSSAGKFWEPNGFKRFLDEAAQKLGKLYGDPRSVSSFANMPIVIVSYSGGFGPTLAVLDRGGVRSRVRGLVLLDSLYAGIDQFADWIANNRSTFFVSAYTPHTAYHNADLERLLREHAVPYGSELRHDHLNGMVTFLPTGDISHRDFVNRAWADNPIKDILARMDDIDPKIQTAGVMSSIPPVNAASNRNY
jgi:hypothetical protein